VERGSRRAGSLLRCKISQKYEGPLFCSAKSLAPQSNPESFSGYGVPRRLIAPNKPKPASITNQAPDLGAVAAIRFTARLAVSFVDPTSAELPPCDEKLLVTSATSFAKSICVAQAGVESRPRDANTMMVRAI
jgi:hypothetical protein